MRLLLFFLLTFSLSCAAQRQGNIWYFGHHAGLDFNSGSPVPLLNGATYNDNYPHSEGTSCISDSLGQLLFYTNGRKVWNRNHVLMPHGDSLLGHLSSTQSSLIVPQPGNSRYYYVFTTDAFYHDSLQFGFRYSVVDMCLDNGFGDIITDVKNVKLVDTVAEKVTAVRHSNNKDYWIITHKYYSNAFYAYLLSDLGIVDTVISAVGSVHDDYCMNSSMPTRAALGQLKASPDGSRLICVNGQGCNNISELFDFDKTTGVVSNPLALNTDNTAVGLYGASFSPDNSKVYITSWMNNDRVYQYDLSSGNPLTIYNSKTVVSSHPGGPWYMAMQLGPDGKIYIAEYGQSTLSVINNPNAAGSACNFVNAGLSLNGRYCSMGLPNFIDFFDYSNRFPDCTTGIAEVNANSSISLSPNPFSGTLLLDAGKYTENVRLCFYNPLGQEVHTRTLHPGEQFEVQLPAGIYFYRAWNEEQSKLLGAGKLIRN